ncbi:acetolactate synthase large subunit [Centipeda periodontii DSM 2778]|uniref:Acetolactate synthase large subunit n=1 Tax=Centipeda periodontii DSM 2778 TaxID=888060 RepID=F5RKS3_9FIRM|nr:acetolactate synthase large subunit [Centipeda periodontii DSM 2778]
MTKRLPNGHLCSPQLEDMAPFLPEEELKRNMYVPLVLEKDHTQGRIL